MRRHSRPWSASGFGWRRSTLSTYSPTAVVRWIAYTHIVRIPSHIVEESIAEAPSSFVLCGRDPEKDVLLEPGRVSFANFTEGLEVNDLRTGEHRVSVKQDIADAITVVDAMSEIDLALLPVAARDCDHAPSAHGYDAAVRSTTKHVHVPAISKAETEAVIEMAASRLRWQDVAARAADHERRRLHRQLR